MTRIFRITIIFVLHYFGFLFSVSAQEDYPHFSKVFGKEKFYRIFLPADYHSSSIKYPVIYYFHGNNGTHKVDYKGIKEAINNNSVILVAWNGRSDDGDSRPYNIGNHSNIKYETQFKDYFLELTEHIDSNYRTLPNRENRGVYGHSMGGIMSFYIAGKYPDMIGTAVNSKGSPEFFIGSRDIHTLYPVRHLFKNLQGIRLRFINSTDGELVNLNREVNTGALNEGLQNYEYIVYEGGHSLKSTEFIDAINFISTSFRNPLPTPNRWTHTDIYPDFKVWGYEVESNLSEPGFIELYGVTIGGMGVTTRKWQPSGRIIPGVVIDVKTPSLYEPNKYYKLLDYNVTQNIKNISEVKSDENGRINFSVNNENHQIGVVSAKSAPEIVLLNYEVEGSGIFLNHLSESKIKLHLLNRGGASGKNLKVHLSTTSKDVSILNPIISVNKITSFEDRWPVEKFIVKAYSKPVLDGSPFRVHFNLTIEDDEGRQWVDEFEAPIYYDIAKFENIGIDDGDGEIYGKGNGNNIAEPGEDIMIYEITNSSHKLRLYYDDTYVENERLFDEMQPDKWGDGYSLSSIVHISKDCPPGHQIKFLASYEIKDWKTIKRNVHWGVFTITVGGEN
tara:strand:- start:5868 stop:7718 length:1851 start_codon:yes stop_codon:yes gene_type:complete